MDNFLKIVEQYYQIVQDKTSEILTPTVKSLQPHLQQHEIFIDDELIIKIILGMTVFIITLTFVILFFTTRKTNKKTNKIEEKFEKEEIKEVTLPVIREERVTTETAKQTESTQTQELNTELERVKELEKKEPTSPKKEPTSPKKEPTSPKKEPTSPKKEPTSPQKEPTSPKKEPTSPQKEPTSPKKEIPSPQQEQINSLDTPGEVENEILKTVEPSFATEESATAETGSAENKDKVTKKKRQT